MVSYGLWICVTNWCLIQVCSGNQECINGELLLGFTSSREANAGIQVFRDAGYSEECFNMVFSIDFAKKLTKKIDKLQFEAILKPNQYVEMVDKDWVDVIPSSPNSYEFHSSIYNCFNACPPSKICLVDITAWYRYLYTCIWLPTYLQKHRKSFSSTRRVSSHPSISWYWASNLTRFPINKHSVGYHQWWWWLIFLICCSSILCDGINFAGWS